MKRLLVIIKKNLLRFIRNPKSLGFLILIPVMYYILLGFIFGGINFENGQQTTYYVGWIDNDTTKADYTRHPNYNLDEIFDILNETDALYLINYSSLENAKKAALDGKIDAYVYFPQGFEEYLENSSKIEIGFWNNDNLNSPYIENLFAILKSSTQDMFKITNITANADNVLGNFNNYDYQSIVKVDEGFETSIANNENANITLLFRNATSVSKKFYINGTILSITNNYLHSFSSYTANATISNQTIINSKPYEPNIEYTISFLQSVSPAVKASIENIIAQTIDGVVNSNPAEIEIAYEVESAKGQEVNNITFSAPGYLLYGPMTILSFALVILTGEKKDGIYKRLSSTKVRNWEIILGNIISNIMLIFMQFGIGALILSFFGWNPVIASLIDAILGVIITMFIFSFFLLSLAFALAPVFKDPDSAGGGVWIIIIPLAMVSGIFVPIELFGEGMKAFAAWLPTRFAVVALQNLLLKGLPIFHIDTLIQWSLLILYSAIIFIIGVRSFNKFKQ
jgi:ABC-type Na+ efflux pump permease subunit